MPREKTKSKKERPPSPSPVPLTTAPSNPRASSGKKSSSSILIRPARHSDFPAIEQLAGALFPRASPTFTSDDHYFIAQSGPHLAGWVHLRAQPHSMVLQGLAVHPLFRRRGIGQSLLRLSLRAAERLRPEQPLSLKVKSSNVPALTLYLQEGFVLRRDWGRVYSLERQSHN